jgi:hypothetical protein
MKNPLSSPRMIILKCIMMQCVCGLDSTSGHGPVEGCCEHGNEPSGYIIGAVIFA